MDISRTEDVCGWKPKGPSTSIIRSGSFLVTTFFRLIGSMTVNFTPGGSGTGLCPTRNAHGPVVENGRGFLAAWKAGIRNSGRLTEDLHSILED